MRSHDSRNRRGLVVEGDYYGVVWELLVRRFCAGDVATAAPAALLFDFANHLACNPPYPGAAEAPVLRMLDTHPPYASAVVDATPPALTEPVYSRAILAAAHIDPLIDPVRAKLEPEKETEHSFPQPSRFVDALIQIAQLAREWPHFDDVFLMDGLLIGGGQKYQLQVMESLISQGLSRAILVVCGEDVGKQPWLSKVPTGAIVLDLAQLTPGMPEVERLDLAHRVLCEYAPRARVHCKPIRFADSYLRRYAASPSERRFIYYRWCDNVSTFGDVVYTEPSGPRHIDEFGEKIDILLGDCQYIVDKDAQRCGSRTLNTAVLPAAVQPAPAPRYRQRSSFSYTLLWASRIERQKRATLLRPLGYELQRRYGGRVRLEVWGTAKHPVDLDTWVRGVPCVDYRGVFRHFHDIDLERYDALIYTSLFDGMPNIVLECLSSGLPVISEPVGGVPEVVVEGVTGTLVPLSYQDDVAAKRYADAIDQLYRSFDDAARMSETAWMRVSAQRDKEGYDARVNKIFSTLNQLPPRIMKDTRGDLTSRHIDSTSDDLQDSLRVQVEEQRLEILRLAEELSKARDLQIVHVLRSSNWTRRAKKWKRSLNKLKHRILKTPQA
ncbi:MAG TPA: glycosyltransferase [Burkholderiaceae bacterium]|nr:glycosyltransferase [Burkholderiaceae bacterium]